MLGILKFKAGMAAGVLDGGEDAIFMGESSFRKFMRTVEDLTGTHCESPVEKEQLTLVPVNETARGDTELETHDSPLPVTDSRFPASDSPLPASGDWLSLIGEGEGQSDNERSSGEAGMNNSEINDFVDKSEKQNTVPDDTYVSTANSGNQSLLTSGLAFLTQFTRTLSDTNATQNFVRNLVHQDQTDGKTYLKIPVESEKTIYSILELFTRFLIKNR